MSEPNTIHVNRIEPDRYVIELRSDGLVIRYEAPTAEEVLRLSDLHRERNPQGIWT